MLIVVVVKHVYGMENIESNGSIGTYVYYLNGIYTNGMPFKEKGTISLIK